jgi:regulator of protease activity HflC (stomatin/prohibitin superfamily)
MTFAVLAFVVLVVVLLGSGMRIVPQAQVMVVERLGKFNRTLTSGLNVIVPFIDASRPIILRVENRYVPSRFVDLREQVMGFDKIPVITRDNVAMEVGSVIYYQVIDPVKALYEIENLSLAIDQLVQTNIRNVMGSLALDETLTSRETLSARLRVVLDEATEKWGVKVTRVELKEIEPPPQIKTAMAMQMTAERERRAAVTAAEGQKTAQILQAEGEKASRILRAEGERDAAIAQAEGRRQAQTLTAQGESAAIKLVYGAIHEGRPTGDVLAIKYLETLQTIAAGPANKFFIPYEATAFLASLSSLKDALKVPPPAVPPKPPV